MAMPGVTAFGGGTGNDMIWGGGGRDTFVFTAGTDQFMDVSAEIDTVLLDERLWGSALTPLDVVNRFGALQGRDATLDFGGGNRLTVEDIGSLTALSDIIDFL